jgi:ubiquinol-cytochrome c reductase cytochrome b subunit
MNDSRVPSHKRIGPHNKNILDFITGSLLGDGYLEKHGNGSRLCLQQEQSNKSYLFWLHQFLWNHGYCNFKIPDIKERIGNKSKIRYILRLKTWTYSSFNSIQNKWYKNNKKILPVNIDISPLALAIWIMDNGSRLGKGLKLCTNNFTYDECKILQDKLITQYDFKVS